MEQDAALDLGNRALLQRSFFEAVGLNSVKATQRLIQAGVDPEALNWVGQTARMVAEKKQGNTVLKILDALACEGDEEAQKGRQW